MLMIFYINRTLVAHTYLKLTGVKISMLGKCHSFFFVLFLAYTMAKYGMSMCVLGMAQEFKDDGIAVNALWPKTGGLGKM